MSKKRVVLGIIACLCVILIAGGILAVQSSRYTSVTYGHGADQIRVNHPYLGDMDIEQAMGALDEQQRVTLGGTVSAVAPASVPSSPQSSTQSAQTDGFDFYTVVKDDANPGATPNPTCEAGYREIGAFHTSSAQLRGIGDRAQRTAAQGWLVFCVKPSETKDITANTMPVSQPYDCQLGYTQIFSIARSGNNPMITAEHGGAMNNGLFVLCGKNTAGSVHIASPSMTTPSGSGAIAIAVLLPTAIIQCTNNYLNVSGLYYESSTSSISTATHAVAFCGPQVNQ